jgi:hypothetical protein
MRLIIVNQKEKRERSGVMMLLAHLIFVTLHIINK